jgi:hypothetical protein
VKPGRAPRSSALLAALAVVVLGVTACTSDPSPKRVAEDLINTLAETDEERECMLDILDGYSAGELEDLGNAVNEGDQAEQTAAQTQLDEFQARLSSCR